MSRPPVGIKGQKGVFDWPLRGAIHRTFGDKNGNHKGIEIRAPEGTPVLAAAAGRVIYSDTGIRGFGHLVILQHDDDYFTIYGYNRSNLVSSGAYVSRGQKIALSGVPASGGPPRLHFELRRGKTPVNPILYLP
jgi:lipoprotein NlpD